MDIALLYQRGPLLSYCRLRLPYYTSRAPSNLPQMEIALLHQTGPLLITPDVDCPTTPDIPWTDRPPQTGPTQLIDPKCTEPYYTKEALPT